jgi:hypothetical protein
LRSAWQRSMVPSTLRRGAWWLMAFRDLFESTLMRYPACKLDKLFGITSHLQVSTLESSSAQYILYFQPSYMCSLQAFILPTDGFLKRFLWSYHVIPIPIWNISINNQHLISPLKSPSNSSPHIPGPGCVERSRFYTEMAEELVDWDFRMVGSQSRQIAVEVVVESLWRSSYRAIHWLYRLNII